MSFEYKISTPLTHVFIGKCHYSEPRQKKRILPNPTTFEIRIYIYEIQVSPSTSKRRRPLLSAKSAYTCKGYILQNLHTHVCSLTKEQPLQEDLHTHACSLCKSTHTCMQATLQILKNVALLVYVNFGYRLWIFKNVAPLQRAALARRSTYTCMQPLQSFNIYICFRYTVLSLLNTGRPYFTSYTCSYM